MPETRNFRMNPQLLMDVITRQAGTLSKAVLELVMNAVDAQASRVTITLDHHELLVADDGAGFGPRENIYKFFECFGQPREAHENKTYGAFRMGRGQAMSYGVNTWRTGPHRMEVDIKTRGLDYLLVSDLPEEPGCRIRVVLYNPLGLAGIADARRDIQEWCKYAPIKVYFNDELVSQDPQDAAWDAVTDDAYLRLKDTGTLDVYNLGIHVCSYPAYRFGCGGEVVSRRQLKVNFARNDIQSDCAVWRKIRPLVDARATQRNTGRRNLDDAGRQRLVDQLLNGEIEPDHTAAGFKLFTAVTGRHYSARQIMYPLAPCYSAAKRGDKVAEMLMRRDIAFIFSAETLDRWHVRTVPALLHEVKKLFGDGSDSAFDKPFQAFETLNAGFTGEVSLLQDKELTSSEQLWLAVIDKSARFLKPEDEACSYGFGGRRLAIGVADSGDGWTDGKTYVALNRSFLGRHELDVGGLTAVAHLLLHEACHDYADFADHEHDQEFYERYHDATARGVIGDFVKSALGHLPAAAAAVERQLTRVQMKALDKAQAATAALRKVEEKAETP